jgi:DNA repair protein RadD
LSAIVTGETPKGERDSILRRFKARDLKYLVNVSVLTTGFDAPHVDVIALLRKTESVGLLQQIIGRGLRINSGKVDCLVLDYTTNLEDHCPDGDLFAPVIRAKKAGESNGGMACVCPDCGYENAFTANSKTLDYKVDDAGYCLDLDGNQVQTEWGPMPAHFGRRCQNQIRTGARGEYERCAYRWTFKECPHCGEANDIAARRCCDCGGEIVDPNERLRMDFKALKRNPTQRQTDKVVRMECKPGVSRAGNPTIRVEWVTPWRQFTTWLQPEAKHLRGQQEYQVWAQATEDGESPPDTVTYRKNAETGFFEVLAYNREFDHEPA